MVHGLQLLYECRKSSLWQQSREGGGITPSSSCREDIVSMPYLYVITTYLPLQICMLPMVSVNLASRIHNPTNTCCM